MTGAPRLRAFDVDQSGTLDVLAPHPGGNVYSVQFGAGDATFPDALASANLPPGAMPRDIAVGDFSGDGFDDVVSATTLGVIIQRRNP